MTTIPVVDASDIRLYLATPPIADASIVVKASVTCSLAPTLLRYWCGSRPRPNAP